MSQRRWYRLTPDHVVLLLLVAECLLWLSSRIDLPWWGEGYAVLTAVAIMGLAMLAMVLWFILALIFRWRFQFSIRSLLVLVVVVAVSCSWLVVVLREVREQVNSAIAKAIAEELGPIAKEASDDMAKEALEKGNACFDKGDYDGAIAAYTQAIKFDPKNTRAYCDRGAAYMQKGENDKVIADCNEAIRLDPKYADAYQVRGSAYSRKGDTAKGEEDFAQARTLGYKAGVRELQQVLPNRKIQR